MSDLSWYCSKYILTTKEIYTSMWMKEIHDYLNECLSVKHMYNAINCLCLTSINTYPSAVFIKYEPLNMCIFFRQKYLDLSKKIPFERQRQTCIKQNILFFIYIYRMLCFRWNRRTYNKNFIYIVCGEMEIIDEIL